MKPISRVALLIRRNDDMYLQVLTPSVGAPRTDPRIISGSLASAGREHKALHEPGWHVVDSTTIGADTYRGPRLPAMPDELNAKFRGSYLSSVWEVLPPDGGHEFFVLTSSTTIREIMMERHAERIESYLAWVYGGGVRARPVGEGVYLLKRPIASPRCRLTLTHFSGEMTALDYCAPAPR